MPSDAGPTFATIGDLGAAFRAGRTSPVEATRRCLARIAAADPHLHAFITVTADRALEEAEVAAAELARGHDRGALHGVPIALKDLIDLAGVPTTAGSAQLEDRIPAADAEVVRRLREAGAVILGKLNLHEVAYGASGCVGRYPAARNPRAPAHIAGGSSSGSAVAVAAGMCHAALGTDTSGSIRVPAALCGIVGLKPTYGLVSLRGVLPLAWSYDHVGPMTRTVRDAALVLGAIAGHDPDDLSSAAWPATDPAAALDADLPRPRIGVARARFFAELHPEVAAAVERAVEALRPLAAELREVELAVDDDRTVFRAESYAVHQRWAERSPERYQPETLRRILTGAGVSAPEYIHELRKLQLLRRRAAAPFEDVDVIVTPTVPVPAPAFAELEAEPGALRARELVLMRNTRPFDILGTPALTVPCGATSTGLPIGLQIVAAPGADATALRVGEWFERHAGRLAGA
jgi:aspartyl-tRNA(Asn)/glutamyl-tRNA(Gln) amidotransferase subunit A